MTIQTEPEAADPAVALAGLWRHYAANVYGPDYPLYRSIARAVSGDHAVLDLLLGCPPAAHDPNLLLAAFQYLVLGGDDHPLAAMYAAADVPSDPVPGTPPGPDADVAAAVSSFCQVHRQQIVDLIGGRYVQTNETGRCGALALGLAAAAAIIGEPIGLIDAGASAGPNLALDEYLLDFGDAGRIGPEDSPVHIECEVRGGTVPSVLRVPPIAARAGLDRAPVDVDDEDAARWMLACIWPGTGRQQRARAAMARRAGRPGLVRKGDMVTD